MQDKKSYIDSAIQTIQTEIEGLNSLFSCFDDNYIKAIDLILNCKGRVIVSGMGKSGHVGNKIAATLASTGTPAFFIHPAEASHGDLGMISKDDVVILLSNSGETKELRDIIFYCRRFEIPIIAMVRRAESELVRSSTIPFILSKIPEANKVNAPTTSTTMMLALGDAIAVSLIDAKNFNDEKFGVFHPGGKLGAAFTRVKDIMRKGSEIPLVNQNKKMSEALLEITSKHLGCTAVLDDKNNLVGVVTDGDLRRHIASNFLEKIAAEVMSKSPATISGNMLAVDAIALMNKKSITSLFVSDEESGQNKVIGILHIHDCLRAGVA
jgi:arabinose-5-phosphate isomerase